MQRNRCHWILPRVLREKRGTLVNLLYEHNLQIVHEHNPRFEEWPTPRQKGVMSVENVPQSVCWNTFHTRQMNTLNIPKGFYASHILHKTANHRHQHRHYVDDSSLSLQLHHPDHYYRCDPSNNFVLLGTLDIVMEVAMVQGSVDWGTWIRN